MMLLAVGAVSAMAAGPNDLNAGRADYVRYCASCHGLSGDGRGPVAKVLRTPPTDVRTLTTRYGAPLPLDRVARAIDGRQSITAHGEREMPVWGERFSEVDSLGETRDAQMQSRIAKLVAYLASIQAPTTH